MNVSCSVCLLLYSCVYRPQGKTQVFGVRTLYPSQTDTLVMMFVRFRTVAVATPWRRWPRRRVNRTHLEDVPNIVLVTVAIWGRF